ncbi:MAG: DM13 domain-containing protein [Chloroflexi bacterium]|nr:DM13 domain-containing protein [Chloroflexota bacterium]
MSTRPAWWAIVTGGLVVIGLVLSPIWLKEISGYIEPEEEEAPFPEAYYELPDTAREIYDAMYQDEPQMAIDFVAARLAEQVDVEDPNLPVIEEANNPGTVSHVLTGSFVTLDPTRGASGEANIFILPDQRRLIRLENLEAVGGPDLRVLLTAHPAPQTLEDLTQPDIAGLQLDLGPLGGVLGNQNYEAEILFNTNNFQDGSVVLFSERYNIVFSYASLSLVETPE